MALSSLEEGRLSRPTLEDLVRTLHQCRKAKDPSHALRMHAYLCEIGLDTHRSLGNYLVLTLVEVGNIHDAQQVFNKLVLRNEWSWNALINGYIKHGMSKRALTLYQEMTKDDSLHASTDTYVALLQGCAKLKDIKRGLEIHAKLGTLERSLFIGSLLVSMYGKCGSLEKAQQVFDKICGPTVVPWTALIAGYAEHGQGEKALELFEKMQNEGVSPSAVTFVRILKACGSIGATHKGKEIHAEVERQGLLKTNLFVGSALVDMYAKCGSLERAQRAFDKLPLRNVVSWNTLISCYSENGHDQRVLKCFAQMQFEGVFPNAITFTCVLTSFGNIGDIDKGRHIHAEVERREILKREPFVGNALINMYAKCGFLAKAQQVFDTLPRRDLVSWTALIVGYADQDHGEEALKWFEQLQVKGLSPNAVTYVCSLKACGSIGAIDKGEEIHVEIERRGLLKDGLVGSTLVDTYARCGSLAKAQQVFEKLSIRNVVSWTALMAGYAQLGKSETVFVSFNKMLGEGVKPNLITFVVVLNACSRCGLLNRSQTYFEAMSEVYGIAPILEHHSCIVDLLGRVGQLGNAEILTQKLPVFPDFTVWHIMLGASKKWGNVSIGEQAFKHALCLV